MLLPIGKERASKSPPGGEQENISGKNIQEYTKPGATIFSAKIINALINNQHFNAPRGDQDLKFKREIQV